MRTNVTSKYMYVVLHGRAYPSSIAFIVLYMIATQYSSDNFLINIISVIKRLSKYTTFSVHLYNRK